MNQITNRSDILSCCDGLNVDVHIHESGTKVIIECVKCNRLVSSSDYPGALRRWNSDANIKKEREKAREKGIKYRPKSTLIDEQTHPDVSYKHLHGRP